jgi:endonuclease III
MPMITAYGKKFDFNAVMAALLKAMPGYNVPIVTLIAVQEKDPFKILISAILSTRTKDETTAAGSERLFTKAPDAESLNRLPLKQIEKLIYPIGFYRNKAIAVKSAAKRILEYHGGKVPDTIEELLAFDGVGRKVANLVLGEAFATPAICVDIHVHRISNRMGIIKTTDTHETELDLEKILPRKHWIRYNTCLVAHGQHTCKPISPFCSRCVIKDHCKRIGVERSR